jgi:hypothetical protein
MERRQLYSLAMLVVCAAIGLVVGLMLTNALRGRAARPDAADAPPPSEAGRGLRPDEMLGRLK